MDRRQNDSDRIEKNDLLHRFFMDAGEEMSEELIYAACRGLDGGNYPMLYVTEDLTLLSQTENTKHFLLTDQLLSLEGLLSKGACDTIRTCIETGTEQDLTVKLWGDEWNMRIIPVSLGGLLIFQPAAKPQIGITMAAAKLRDSAQRLLLQAEQLEEKILPDMAAQLRQQAFRILREVNHMQQLSGAAEGMHWETMMASRLLFEAGEMLEQKGLNPSLEYPEEDFFVDVDRRLLLSAWMTLVSNSLRHGGLQTQLTLSIRLRGQNSVAFCVTDDGEGISAEAMQQMNHTWRMGDALSGSWGLGIPYARRIAEMHDGALLILLNHAKDEGGTTVCIQIPQFSQQEEVMNSSSGYQVHDMVMVEDAITPADIELSDALDYSAYRQKKFRLL